MCGLIGMAGKQLNQRNVEMLDDGLFVCSLRGSDSYGVGVVPFNPKLEPLVSKKLGGGTFKYHVPFEGAKALIGHTRSATIGKISHDLAHPFKFHNIVGVHNGTLRHDWRRVLQAETTEVFGSDSQGIFYNFAYDGVAETITKLIGAWALVWWDDDTETLNFLRNNERPLWYGRGKSGNLYWASEPWMINAMLRTGERDRDIIVKTMSDDQKEEKFFHKLPVDTWRRYTFNSEGELQRLDDIALKGATLPPAPAVHQLPVLLSGINQKVWAEWDGQTWNELPKKPEAGTGKILESEARHMVGFKNIKGELYRTVAGELYISKKGSPRGEMLFRDFLEQGEKGCCVGCGTFVQHPIEIGYLADQYDWIACRTCVKDWQNIDEEGDWTDYMRLTDADWEDVPPEEEEDEELFDNERFKSAAITESTTAPADWDLAGEDDPNTILQQEEAYSKAVQAQLERSTLFDAPWGQEEDDDYDDDLPTDLQELLPPALINRMTSSESSKYNTKHWDWWRHRR